MLTADVAAFDPSVGAKGNVCAGVCPPAAPDPEAAAGVAGLVTNCCWPPAGNWRDWKFPRPNWGCCGGRACWGNPLALPKGLNRVLNELRPLRNGWKKVSGRGEREGLSLEYVLIFYHL